MHRMLRPFFAAGKSARVAAIILAVGCCTHIFAAPKKQARVGNAEPAFDGAISVDGPGVWVDAKKPGRLVRLRFAGRAGERIGLGLSNVELAPESASTLVVTLRGPDGEIVRGSEPMRCFAETDLHPIDGCDGQFTLGTSGTYVIEVDTPFTAAARFRATLSTPASATLAIDQERSIEVKRAGQPARFRIPVAPGKDVSVSARDASPGRGGGEFTLRVFRPDGRLLAKAEGTPALGASLPVRGEGGDYYAEIDPAHAKTGVFLASARAAAELSVNGAPVEFATHGPNEVLRVGFSGNAGEGIALAVAALQHQPDVDSNSRFVVLGPDGSRVSFVSCITHVMYGTVRPQPCKLIVPALPATGRYTVEISPPARAGVSGRLLLTGVVKGQIAAGTPIALAPMRPGQVARYVLHVNAGQRVGVQLQKIVASPEGDRVSVTLTPEKGMGMFMSGIQRGSDVTINPMSIAAAGTYVVVVDPINGSLQSGELSISVEEGKPQ